MNLATLISRLQDAAAKEKNDAMANTYSQLANRLAHQGTPFEKPLTGKEIRLISQFVGA